MRSFKILLLLVIASVGFTACEDDDKETIYGTWEFQDVTGVWTFCNHPGLTLAIDHEETVKARESIHTYTFKEDGTYQKRYGDRLDDKGSFIYTNSLVTFISEEKGTHSFIFSLSKGKAKKTIDNSTHYMTIDAEGNNVINTEKIKNIIQKYPEQTSGIVDSIIPLLEITQVNVITEYSKK